jgi:hypothetical protein
MADVEIISRERYNSHDYVISIFSIIIKIVIQESRESCKVDYY